MKTFSAIHQRINFYSCFLAFLISLSFYKSLFRLSNTFIKLLFRLLTITLILLIALHSKGQNCNIDSLKSELVKYEGEEAKMALLYKITICYDYGSVDSSLYYCQMAVSLSDKEKNDKWICRSNSKLGLLLARKGRFEEANVAFQKCESACKTDKEFSIVYNNQSIFYGMSNQSRKAIKVLEKSLDLNVKLKNPDGQAKAMMNLAINHEVLSEHEKALDYLTQALHINDSLGTESNLAINHSMLAGIYESINEDEKALVHLDKAIPLTQKLNMGTSLAYAYFNKGKSLKKLNKKEEAISNFKKAIDILEPINDQRALGAIYGSLAKSLFDKEEYEEALSITEKNILRTKDMGDFPNLVLEMVTRGRIFVEQKKYTKAYEDAYGSLKIAEDQKIMDERLDIYQLLIRLDSITKNYTKGFSNLKDLLVFKDSIINVEESKKIAELMTRLETNEKEKEIDLLEKDNRLKAITLSQQNRNFKIGSIATFLSFCLAGIFFFQRRKIQKTKQKLEEFLEEKDALLKEKETLLKEIHHRVKNNLQLIMSLLNIQADSDTPQTIEDFLYKGQNRVKSMSLIHEQLYQSDDFSAINMKDYLEKLVPSIFQTFGSNAVDYEIQAEEYQLDIDKAIPLGLIINELVNNSLKHAFKNNKSGKIGVSLSQQNENMLIEITDNGQGYEEKNNQDSIGLQLVKILVQQLKGNFNLQQNSGTTAKILFPKT